LLSINGTFISKASYSLHGETEMTTEREALRVKAFNQWEVMVVCKKCGHRRSINGTTIVHKTGTVTREIWNMESDCVMCQYQEMLKERGD